MTPWTGSPKIIPTTVPATKGFYIKEILPNNDSQGVPVTPR